MKNIVLLSAIMVFGLVVFSGSVSLAGDAAGDYPDDSTITNEINGMLADDPAGQSFKVDVTTIQGYVLLQGFVNSRETEARIVNKIRKIRGVKSVKSSLTVERTKYGK